MLRTRGYKRGALVVAMKKNEDLIKNSLKMRDLIFLNGLQSWTAWREPNQYKSLGSCPTAYRVFDTLQSQLHKSIEQPMGQLSFYAPPIIQKVNGSRPTWARAELLTMRCEFFHSQESNLIHYFLGLLQSTLHYRLQRLFIKLTVI